MSELQNKSYSGSDAQSAFDDMHRIFHAYKDANDERLAELEQKLSGDVLIEEKVARIDAALDDQRRKMDRILIEKSRPHLAGAERGEPFSREHKSAFRAYMRTGEAAGLKGIEEKALSAGSGPDGGYLVPVPAEREILRRMANISPIRAVASVREISTATYKKAFCPTGPAAGWVAESDARPQTASQQIADLTFPAMELYAMPAATQTLLDDAAVDLEQWIAEEVNTVFAEQEGAAFINGNGVGKPSGLLSYTKSNVAGWSWGKTAYLPTGVAAGFAATNPSDILVDLVYTLRAGYRQNGRFLMNRKTQAQIRKFKASTGEYLWSPPAQLGAPATLMNFPIIEAEDMPDIAAGSFALAFADFNRCYLIVDRVGIRVLRDPYSTKPYVLFYTTKRVGGGIQDFDAIKLLKFDVS
jgi:HK97 family phage major capsid protein